MLFSKYIRVKSTKCSMVIQTKEHEDLTLNPIAIFTMFTPLLTV